MPDNSDNLRDDANTRPEGFTPTHCAQVITTVVLLLLVLISYEFNSFKQSAALKNRTMVLPGYRWQDSHQTIVIAVRSGCAYCKASKPFYAKLLSVVARAPQGHVRLVFMTFEDEDLAALSVPPGTPSNWIRARVFFPDWITGTPTIASVDQYGKVISVWSGYLDERQQEQFIRFVQSL